MKPRGFAVFAVVFGACAVAAWMWLWNDGGSPANPNPDGNQGSAETNSGPPSGVAGNPVQSTVPAVPGEGAPDGAKDSAAPVEPIRIATSVMPGLPMVRSTPSPPRPADPALRVRGIAAADSRPDWQVTGTAELGKVQAMLRDFRTRMGQNPVGSNAEIMKSLMGGNPVNARLGPPEGQTVNEQGELVDQWGTPYFFHQMTKDKMEIRSAGPDRKMWTNDDLVSK